MTNNRGFSIVEMVVAMAIFVGIMLIVSSTFENIIRTGGQQMRSAETNTEGIVGLEMFRSDLEHVGFGLPWSYPVTPIPAIDETADGAAITGVTPLPTSLTSFDETTAPRAIMVGAGSTGMAYLVIKSNRVALNDTVQRWAYVNYSSASGVNKSYVKKWEMSDDFNTNSTQDLVITVSSTFAAETGLPSRSLVMNSTGANPNYYYQVPGTTPVFAPASYQPGDASELYIVYGVDPGSVLRMPYNRADYYINRPSVNMPESCNSGTGILYKGVVKHSDGTFTEYPLLNCVGDMQVEFELDYNDDGNLTYSPALTANNGSALTAAQIRSQLKNIRVYILAHEGKKDRSYSYPNDTIQVGDAARPNSSGRTWSGAASCTTNCMETTFGTDWRNYRWKVYTIVVQPKNLN